MAEMSQGNETPSTQAAPKDSRPLYEIGFHVVPTLEEAKISDVVGAVRAELDKIKATVVGEQFPTKITLAYTIERAASGKRDKYNEAYFGWFRFVVEDRSGITAFEHFLQNNKQIIRFLLISTQPEEAVSPRRAVFSSNRLEGETIKKPTSAPEVAAVVSEEELDKSLEALVSEDNK